MVGDYGEILVVDWGIARVRSLYKQIPTGTNQSVRIRPQAQKRGDCWNASVYGTRAIPSKS